MIPFKELSLNFDANFSVMEELIIGDNEKKDGIS
jgi:hypothetical protein